MVSARVQFLGHRLDRSGFLVWGLRRFDRWCGSNRLSNVLLPVAQTRTELRMSTQSPASAVRFTTGSRTLMALISPSPATGRSLLLAAAVMLALLLPRLLVSFKDSWTARLHRDVRPFQYVGAWCYVRTASSRSYWASQADTARPLDAYAALEAAAGGATLVTFRMVGRAPRKWTHVLVEVNHALARLPIESWSAIEVKGEPVTLRLRFPHGAASRAVLRPASCSLNEVAIRVNRFGGYAPRGRWIPQQTRAVPLSELALDASGSKSSEQQ